MTYLIDWYDSFWKWPALQTAYFPRYDLPYWLCFPRNDPPYPLYWLCLFFQIWHTRLIHCVFFQKWPTDSSFFQKWSALLTAYFPWNVPLYGLYFPNNDPFNWLCIFPEMIHFIDFVFSKVWPILLTVVYVPRNIRFYWLYIFQEMTHSIDCIFPERHHCTDCVFFKNVPVYWLYFFQKRFI